MADSNKNQVLKKVRKPIVLLPTDVKQVGEHLFHMAGQKYIKAVAEAAGGMPLLIPAMSDHIDIDALLAITDGIVLTGAVSNVHPSHFDQEVYNPALPLDPARDALTLKLIREAIKAEVPILAICRGFQEMKVAFGGSLHQAVQELPNYLDHREIKSKDANVTKDAYVTLEKQYAPVHAVTLKAGGKLASIMVEAEINAKEIKVNSLHGQGLNRLGKGLTAEAHAPDGLVEAITVDHAATFAMGVQWHPEWNVMNTPAYLAVFNAFGDACRVRMKARAEPE